MPVALLLAAFVTAADQDITSVDLEELLDFETDVASTTALSLRESPGIVTVVTRDEIIRAGARDLMDVLNLVPGVGFGVDVQSIVGIGFRGLWGHEGKVLLMVDGQPMNELLYGTLQFGNHIPVEHIERVEVIRGPGSVIYGGFAELAVIDVITRSADTLDGAAVAGSYGRMRDTTGRWMGHVGFGKRFGDLEVTAAASIGHAIRSDRIYVDPDGARFDMQDASDLNPGFVDVGVRYRGLSLRLIHDDYRTTEQSDYGLAVPAPVEQNFRNTRAELRYDWVIVPQLTLTPRVSYTLQKPWRSMDRDTSSFYDKTAQRLTTGFTARYAPLVGLDLALGGDVYFDRASINAADADVGLNTTFGGEPSVTYRNYVAFADVLWRTAIVNIEGGARFEHHSQFGGSFVPRLALTRVFGDFHVKGLASRAFRAPTFENIATNPNINPERTTAFELEGGYRMNSHTFFSVNLFDMTTTRPIVYAYDATVDSEQYTNAGKIGSRGVESTVRFVYEGSYATLGYSFYTTAGKDNANTYRVPGRDDVLLAWPAHKLTLSTSIALSQHISIGGTATVLSRRYALTPEGEADSFAPVAYLSATAYAHDIGLTGLEFSLSLHNIGDAQNPLIQPYDGGHPPLPGGGREVVARLAYAF